MSTFPQTVSASGSIQAPDNCNPGPWDDGNNRYVVLQDSGNTVLTVFKTTDFGDTWTEMDAVNAKPYNIAGGFTLYWTTQNKTGQKIHVTYWDTSGNLILSTFNTATDTWSGVDVSSGIGIAPTARFGGSIVCKYRPGNGDVVAVFVDTVATIVPFGDFSRCDYAVCNLATWSGTTPCGFEGTTAADLYNPFPVGVTVDGNDNLNVFYDNWTQATPPSDFPQQLLQQAIRFVGGVGGIQLVDSYVDLNEVPFTFQVAAAASSSTDKIYIAYPKFLSGTLSNTDITYSSGTAADSIIFTTITVNVSAGSPNFLVTGGIAVAVLDTLAYLFWIVQDIDTGDNTFSYRLDNGGTVTTAVIGVYNGSVGQLTANVYTSNTDAFAITFHGTQHYWEQAGVAPPVVVSPPKSVGGGAVYFPRYFNKTFLLASVARIYGTDWVTLRDNPPLSSFFLFPNDQDLCLSREFQLYNLIDRTAMSCARKPECFLNSERDWLDSPPGWRAFNPVGVLALPAPDAGDTVVFRFRVPYGYDGVITAQYHGYTLGFTEGSGDLVWRVRADGRYLRDEGSMLLSLGNPKQLSPVYGGLQLRSGNLVEYLVSAPNVSGLLPPGGNILAGLHGFFYPRS